MLFLQTTCTATALSAHTIESSNVSHLIISLNYDFTFTAQAVSTVESEQTLSVRSKLKMSPMQADTIRFPLKRTSSKDRKGDSRQELEAQWLVVEMKMLIGEKSARATSLKAHGVINEREQDYLN